MYSFDWNLNETTKKDFTARPHDERRRGLDEMGKSERAATRAWSAAKRLCG